MTGVPIASLSRFDRSRALRGPEGVGAAGDLEGRSTSVDASGADTNQCPTTGTRETDLLPCAGAHVRQVGTMTVEVPHTHVSSLVGTANLLRIVAPATNTTQ